MSTKARKARKRAGIPFVKAPKVGTPLEERAVPLVSRKVDGVLGWHPSNRAVKKLADRSRVVAPVEPKPARKRLLSRKGK